MLIYILNSQELYVTVNQASLIKRRKSMNKKAEEKLRKEIDNSKVRHQIIDLIISIVKENYKEAETIKTKLLCNKIILDEPKIKEGISNLELSKEKDDENVTYLLNCHMYIMNNSYIENG